MRWIAFTVLLLSIGTAHMARADHVTEHVDKKDAIRFAHLLIPRHVPDMAKVRFGPTVADRDGRRALWTITGIAYDPDARGDAAEHVFVAKVRLTCEDTEDELCWRLERVGLDFKPVFRRTKYSDENARRPAGKQK